MKTILNKTLKPIKIPLPGSKRLHLGPGKTGQVSDQATQRPSFKKLVKEGAIEVVGEGASETTGAEGSRPTHESTHGHPQTTVVLPKGDR